MTDHPVRMALLGWLEVPFFVGMVPACLAVAWVVPPRRTRARHHRRRVLTALGFGAGFAATSPAADLATALQSRVWTAAVLERVDDATGRRPAPSWASCCSCSAG